MAIQLYRSNRTEALVTQLARVLARPPNSPLAPEVVAVQGKGMERFLGAALAKHAGVCANVRFPFPRALIEGVLDAALGPSESGFAFDARGLGWAFASLVRSSGTDLPELSEVARYVERNGSPDPWLDLGMHLGEVFDRALLFRPEQLARYERGEGSDPQAVLWRALVRQHGDDHLANRAARYLRGPAPLAGSEPLPKRVCVFGVSSLPPLFLRLLDALSQSREVHVFSLVPTREYMGDLERRAARADAVTMLGSLARLSRDFQDLLETAATYEEPEGDLFHDPGTQSLLSALQSDILHLRSRHPDSNDHKPLALPRSDRSVRVHDCHSRTRELEVLRDQLLAAFDADPTLTPRDVVVLASDIETYAPSIEAVFGDDLVGAMPFRVADREVGKRSGVASTALAMLELFQSRVTLGELADFLHRDHVRQQFGLSEADVDLAVRWLELAGARFGLSAEARALRGHPDTREGTMRFALDRLVLGHAMLGEDEPLFGEVLPFDDVEGQSDLLEGLSNFIDALQDWAKKLAVPRSCAQFCSDFAEAVDALIEDAPESAGERVMLREALAQLSNAARAASCDAPISLHSFARQLSRELSSRAYGHDFLQAGITFCRHVPMRALPFRIVCMLGMEDETFPRRVPSSSFDLVANAPQKGDRTAADDDRQVFLEALLSARERLIITHRGRGIEDNGVRPRATVVDQLLSVIDSGWFASEDDGRLRLDPDERSAKRRVTLEHPLWPFDDAYFPRHADAEWFTYDAQAAQARTAMRQGQHGAHAFVEGALDVDGQGTQELSLDALISFFRHPSRGYLQRGLELALPRDEAPLPDREPMLLQGLDRYFVAEYLREHDVEDAGPLLQRLAARSLLPLGDAARLELQITHDEVRQMLDMATLTGERRSVRVDLPVGDVRVVGQLHEVYGYTRRAIIVSRLAAKHRLAFWIGQLLLCSQGAFHGLLVSRANKPIAVSPVQNAAAHLADLVSLYQLGRSMPLPLFAEASLAYAAKRQQGKPLAEAEAAAENKLNSEGAQGMPSPGNDVHLNQIYGLASRRRIADLQLPGLPRELDFASLAVRVFGPMLEAGL